MTVRLHRGGRFRTWLGGLFGGGAELGDRIYRRGFHGLGALIVLYYWVPAGFFRFLTNADVLLGALAVVLSLESLRHLVGLELPTLRAYESRRVASFAFFSVALVTAILLFPKPIAAAVVIGAAVVDPLIGELRARAHRPWLYPVAPALVYLMIVSATFLVASHPPLWSALEAGVLLTAPAIIVEAPKEPWIDDDWAMILIPGGFLWLVATAVPLGIL